MLCGRMDAKIEGMIIGKKGTTRVWTLWVTLAMDCLEEKGWCDKPTLQLCH